jgi:nucleoid-associated protein YgaU
VVDEQAFGPIYGPGDEEMHSPRRKRITLTPALAMAALGALIAIPALSSSRLYAASPERFTTATVQRGDSLWSLAEKYTADGGNVQETIDQISAANHLAAPTIEAGQKLKIPQ